ncbi:MAG: BtrH N-terminal domain-containing protein, partial [Nocardioides sp.]
MLSAMGIELSEPMVCGLGGGIGFMYAVFEFKTLDHPLLTIVTQHHPMPWWEAVAGHLALTPTTVRSSAPAPAFAKVRHALDAGRPALIQVARGQLPWREDVPAAEAADPHPVLLTGHDGSDLIVLDEDEHRIGQDALGAAWAAHRQGRFAVTTLPETLPENVPPDVQAAARRAIATTHAHLTGPVLGHAFDVNFGLSGIARLRDDLFDTSTKRGWARRFATAPAFEVAMVRLAECLTWAHGAEGATRLVYADFLAEAGYAEAAQLARTTGAQWSCIADVAAALDDPSTTLPELADRVAGVHDVEIALAEALAVAKDRP